MLHVRDLHKLGYIKQESDMADNDHNDLSRWLTTDKAKKHFITPRVTGKMSEREVQGVHDGVATQLSNSLRLVFHLAVKDRLCAFESGGGRALHAAGGSPGTRSASAK